MDDLNDRDEWGPVHNKMTIALTPADFGRDIRPIGLDDKDEWESYGIVGWYHRAFANHINMQVLHFSREMHYPPLSDLVGTIRLRDDLQALVDEKLEQQRKAEVTIAEITDSIIHKPKPPTDLSLLKRKDKIDFGPSLLERLVSKPKPQRRWIR